MRLARSSGLRADDGEFSIFKAVAETRVAMRRELFWFPYRKAQLDLLRRMAKVVYWVRGRG